MPYERYTPTETANVFRETFDAMRGEGGLTATLHRYIPAARIIEHSRRHGSHFFDADAMRVFGSRVADDASEWEITGTRHLDGRKVDGVGMNRATIGRVFLFRTSEIGAPMTDDPRAWTVRYAVEVVSGDGRYDLGHSMCKWDLPTWHVGDLGNGFRGYKTAATARAMVRRMVQDHGGVSERQVLNLFRETAFYELHDALVAAETDVAR